MKKIEKLSTLLAEYFTSDALFHVRQKDDGGYVKKSGRVTAAAIQNMFERKQAIACYQRNLDHTVKWICLDFDILKKHLDTDQRRESEKHLLNLASGFVNYLRSVFINHFIEFSGNRGLHIWIPFKDPIFPQTAFEVINQLIEKSSLSPDRTLIGIDLFPSSASHKATYGKAVKIPISFHAKSKFYSYLLNEIPTSFETVCKSELNDDIIDQQIQILETINPEDIASLENKLNCSFEFQEDMELGFYRINTISVSSKKLSVADILEHWKKTPILNTLRQDILAGELSNDQRKLLVGMLKNISNKEGENIGNNILLDIFSGLANYDEEKTRQGLKRLEYLQFPTQEIIETYSKISHAAKLEKFDLLNSVVPNFVNADDGQFDVYELDLKVTKIAEQNYLYQNDEVRCVRIIEELTSYDVQHLKIAFQSYLNSPQNTIELYTHLRFEEGKAKPRVLVSLSAKTRLFTTWVIKQISSLYDYSYSENSFGYKLNLNFSTGYIFKPWLYQWIQFLSGIGASISDTANSDFYIVKTDIKSFYDTIGQDNLERFLLNGFNSSISAQLGKMEVSTKEKYENLIAALMRITRISNPTRIGLPQGPAYARYLAELFLSQVDEEMDLCLRRGHIEFYHRYVDDIFFITTSEKEAKNRLKLLEELLAKIGLTINQEKTSICQIKNFGVEFNEYRAQSKYAIDSISSNFDAATNYEKELALNEFHKLISTQDANNDAVFLFSHLAGVELADRYRDDVFLSIIKSGIGRGNLYKHVFMHVLDRPHLWEKFDEITLFNPLQSEIFTSVALDILSTQDIPEAATLEFLQSQLHKLSETPTTNEHLIYLRLFYRIGKKLVNYDPTLVLRCISPVDDSQHFKIDVEVLDSIGTVLNSTDDLGVLVSYLFPLCMKSEIDAETLTGFSKIFFAKLLQDQTQGTLDLEKCSQEFSIKSVALKFYQLLCLFSLSDSNKSHSVLSVAWEFCAALFNSFDIPPARYREAIWYRNFDLLDLSIAHLNVFLTSTSEQAIWRGARDKHGIYAHFLNALIVCLLTKEREESREDFKDILIELRGKGKFYEWLLTDDVDLFPSKPWFTQNVISNNCIILKKDLELLIRKPSTTFSTSEAIADQAFEKLAGYSDYVVSYPFNTLVSIQNAVQGDTFLTMLSNITKVIEAHSKKEQQLPNFFSNARLVNVDIQSVFNIELCGHESFVVDGGEGIETYKTSFDRFIERLFYLPGLHTAHAFESEKNKLTLKDFHKKYISVLDSEVEIGKFLQHINLLLGNEKAGCTETTFDLAVAASLYNLSTSHSMGSPLARIRRFLIRYDLVHTDPMSKHILKPDNLTPPRKSNLKEFILSLHSALARANDYRPDLHITLADDVHTFFEEVADLALGIEDACDLDKFVRATASVSFLTNTINIDKNSYTYEAIKVLNPSNGTLEVLGTDHLYLLQSSEDIFCFQKNNEAYVYLMQKEFTIAYAALEHRAKHLEIGAIYNSEESSVDHYDLDIAAEVIAIHRDLNMADAKLHLQRWLSHLPGDFRKEMLNLIEAHEYMRVNEIEDFKNFFNSLRREKKNPFLLKPIRDFSGIHRMLSQDAEVGRHLDDCGPGSIVNGGDEATLVSDICLSGFQTIKALTYYLDLETQFDTTYFPTSDLERDIAGQRLRNLKTLNLGFVLYTSSAIEKIKTFLEGIIPDIEVNIAAGRDISETAFLDSTNKLSEKSKREIIEFLQDTKKMEHLIQNVFDIKGSTRKNLKKKLSNCDTGINVVARYKSMPKKGLDFLFSNIQGKPDSSLFLRVREKNE